MPFDFTVPKPLLGTLFMVILVLEVSKPSLSKWRAVCGSIPWARRIGVLAMVFMGSLAIVPFDEYLLRTIQTVNFPGKQGLVQAGSLLGTKHGMWIVLYVGYFITYFGGMVRQRRIAFLALLGSGLTGLTAHLVKFATMRARPDQALGAYSFFNPFANVGSYGPFQSFPSGDVAVVSGAAGYLFLATKIPGAAWLFMLLPIVTALSRIDLNRHWPSDTLFSTGLGLVIGLCLRDYERAVSP